MYLKEMSKTTCVCKRERSKACLNTHFFERSLFTLINIICHSIFYSLLLYSISVVKFDELFFDLRFRRNNYLHKTVIC
jgi:hypothetical protein